jgi:hypothetical protein
MDLLVSWEEMEKTLHVCSDVRSQCRNKESSLCSEGLSRSFDPSSDNNKSKAS